MRIQRRAQVFHADGSQSGAKFLVNFNASIVETGTVITVLADGRFVVGWTDRSSSAEPPQSMDVRAQMFNADGSKFGSEFLVNSTAGTYSYDVTYATVAASVDGGFVVGWAGFNQRDTTSLNIWAQAFNADSPTSGLVFLVNTTVESYQYDPALTSLHVRSAQLTS